MKRSLIGILLLSVMVMAAGLLSCSDQPADPTADRGFTVTSTYDVGIIPADQPAFVTRHRTPALMTTPLPSLIDNGGFEDNASAGDVTFDDWSVWNAGSLYWYVQSGTWSPTGMFAVPAPPEGTFAAMSDQYGPGTHILWQDFTVPAGGATLTFELFIGNRAAVWYHPPSLLYTYGNNQQARVDIIDPDATVTSLASGDILMNVYTTAAGDPYVMTGYTSITADLDALAGETVRLRFSEVDNRSYFQMGVDDVVVTPKADIDIKPDDSPNVVNTNAQGLLTVAILTDGILDAADVDVSTVRLGDGSGTDTPVNMRNNGTYQYGYEDVDGDGDDDLVLHFSIPALVSNGDLTTSSVKLFLSGMTDDDVMFSGWDYVSPF